jgi:hypothetical protein
MLVIVKLVGIAVERVIPASQLMVQRVINVQVVIIVLLEPARLLPVHQELLGQALET